MKYQCPTCFKNFKTKHNYNKHTEFCKFTLIPNNDLLNEIDNFNNEIPNIRELFNFVTILSSKVTKLENENKQLKRYVNQKLIKIDPIVWLNQNRNPYLDFDIWYKNIDTYNYLEIVLSNNLIKGVVESISQNVGDLTPLAAFDNKKLKFYCFNNEVWREIGDKELDQFINKIANHFIVDFNNYLLKNDYLFTSDEYSDIYNNYQNNVYGDSNIEKRNNQIKLQLWNNIKLNVSNTSIL